MSREAMQMALDMLNEIADDVYCDQKLEAVITALRQALVDDDDISQDHVDETVKSEHEPVAWAGTLDFDDDDIEIIPAKAKGKLGTSNCNIPLYTAPPKREWVGLTDEDKHYLNEVLNLQGRFPIIDAIEAKLKEKNG